LAEGLPAGQAAARFGYTPASLLSAARDFRAGARDFFVSGRPGPKTAPAKDAARARILELRAAGHSIDEIADALAAEGTPLNRTGIAEVIAAEGLPRMWRRPDAERGGPAREIQARAEDLDFSTLPERAETRLAGLLLTVPDLIALGVPDMVAAAGYPSTPKIPALSYVLSLLALKLTSTRRVSHVYDIAADPGAALLAALTALPKATALTTYSYRLEDSRQAAFLAALDKAALAAGLADGEALNLDFHAVMAWSSHCSFADCESQNRPSWVGGGSIRRPFARPVRTWTACSSPRLTRCNRAWREAPWARMASRTVSQPAGAWSVNNARSSPVIRIRQGAPGVSCSPGMNPSLTHRCRVEGASPSWRAASATVRSSPSGGSSLG
jgi:hypothetical protein